MSIEMIHTYPANSNDPVFVLEVPENIDECEEIRLAQGFVRQEVFLSFYTCLLDIDKGISLDVWVKGNDRILEIYNSFGCILKIHIYGDVYFFDFLCKFSEMKKNYLVTEKIEHFFEEIHER